MRNTKSKQHPNVNNKIVDHILMEIASKYKINYVKNVNFSEGQNYTFVPLDHNWLRSLFSAALLLRHH